MTEPFLSTWDEGLARIVDHTDLRPVAVEADIRSLCEEALHYSFATVVVAPWHVALAADIVAGSGVGVCSVVSFPLGFDTPDVKVDACRRLIDAGVAEIDAVMNVGAFADGRTDVVESEITGMAKVCDGSAILKLIVETAYHDERALREVTELAVRCGADYVKTSTGFGPSGAAVESVRIMREVARDRAGIKAAGGIRSGVFARALVEAGASRIGCSASREVIAPDD